MAFIDVVKNMCFYRCCSSVAWTLTALWVAEVHSLNFDISRFFHKSASSYHGEAVVTSGIVLSEKGSLNLRMFFLELLECVSYDADHHVAVLTGILDYVNKRLVLQLVGNLTGNNTNVPRNPSFAKPISLRFPVLLWQELHGPVLCDEN